MKELRARQSPDLASTEHALVEELQRLTAENQRLAEGEEAAIRYIREKIDQLLLVIGTMPLRSEELDDDTLIAMDPVGTICDAFIQILDHLRETSAQHAQAQDEIQAIFDSAGAGIIVVDAEMRVQACNSRSREMFSCQLPQMGRPLSEVLGDPGGSEDVGMLGRIAATRSTHEQGDLARGGRYFHLVGTPILDASGAVAKVVLVYTDITARKANEQALSESEQRYRSLYQTMREGVALHEMLYDESGVPVDYIVLDVNPSFERMCGIARDRALGARASELYGAGVAPHLSRYAEVAESGLPAHFETTYEPLGRTFDISAISPVPGKFATIIEDITERKRSEAEIRGLAYFDALTGLPNRTLLCDRLSEALVRAGRVDGQVGVLFLDLDRFKPINDSLGHAIGDLLLKAVGERLKACVRKSDTVARLGGDEFVVVIPGIHEAWDATIVAREIEARLAAPFDVEGHEIYTAPSIGISLYPGDGLDAGTLLRNADMAMYAAKQRGRNTFQYYSDDMNRRAQLRLQLETSLRHALKSQELFLDYQPQIDLERGIITGVEALLRWRRPGHGLVSAAQFIHVTEESGLILAIGEWVLRAACGQGQRWQAQGLPALRMAVNLSPRQFMQPGCVEMVDRILAETSLAPDCLELELTEGMLVEHVEETVKKLRALKEMGVRLVLDDFGTGYSSLSYLKDFPIDRIKIAQTFVRDVCTDSGDAAIVETILAMARSLHLEVIAEGVENQAQFDFLVSHNCKEMQGFYLARPVSGDELARLLREGPLRAP